MALFSADEAGALVFWSFTSDGGRSQGSAADAGDVHPDAIAFTSRMPAGMARMIYWPGEGGGFNFAVEAQTPNGWDRFMHHIYEAQA